VRLLPVRDASQREPAPVGFPSPDAVQIGPRSLKVGAAWCRTIAVVGYPREVGAAWLEPLLATVAPSVRIAEAFVRSIRTPNPFALRRSRRSEPGG
jgi:hypothetical protein